MKAVKTIDHNEVTPNPLDPLNINSRLIRWMSELIDKREDMTVGEEVRAIAAIARIQVIFIKLREEGGAGTGSSGAEVKRFAKAFAANATGKRKKIAGKPDPVIAAITDDENSDELEY